MDSPSSTVTKRHRVPLWMWFAGFGAAEMAIALMAAYLFPAPPAVLRILLPTLAFFGVDPSTPTGMALVVDAAILFGGSFAIWGTVGLIVGALRLIVGALIRRLRLPE